MSRYRFTPEAEEDLFEIWLYIAEDSLQSADRVEAAIYDACAFLAKSPFRGHKRRDLTALPLRFWTLPPLLRTRAQRTRASRPSPPSFSFVWCRGARPVRYRNYIIVYDPANRPLEIVRVLNGARNVPAILGREPPLE